MNTLKVGLLLAGLTGLFVAVGYAFGGTTGMIIAFTLAVLMNFITYWNSDKLVLKMTRAIPVSTADAPEIHAMVEELARRADIPKPAVYVVNDPSPNAFATGRNPANAAVAVNTGLIDLLNGDEVFGVIAHEIAHIKHRDTLTMTVTATIAGAITMIANIGQMFFFFGGSDEEGGNPIGALLMLFLAPLAATIIQLAVSRAREYEADKLGAELAGTPMGLANALLKLERGIARIPGHATPATASLYIANPMRKMGGLANLFMTHPPIEERVRRLQQLPIRDW